MKVVVVVVKKTVMPFPSHMGSQPSTDQHQPDTNLHCETTDSGLVHRRGVPVYATAFCTGTNLYRLVTEGHRCEQLA